MKNKRLACMTLAAVLAAVFFTQMTLRRNSSCLSLVDAESFKKKKQDNDGGTLHYIKNNRGI